MKTDDPSLPAISVIIPAYNRAHCIERTLESVFAQTYTNYEIIVIDDGSKDKTSEVLKPYLNRITYLYQENRGLAGTRTRAAELANAEWIAFLDSDDLWLPDNLETHVAAVTQDDSLILNTTNSLIFREHIGEETDLFNFNGCRREYPDSQYTIKEPLVPYLKFGLLWMQSALIKKSVLIETGPWISDLRVWMDFEYGTRLAKAGAWGLTMSPKVRILRQDDGEVASISSSSQTVAGLAELVRVYGLMLELHELTQQERAFLTRKRADARTKLGLKQIIENQAKSGRTSLRLAYQENPRIASAAKSFLGHMPTFLGGKSIAKKLFR